MDSILENLGGICSKFCGVDRIAIISPEKGNKERKLTYSELQNSILAIAHYLVENRYERGMKIAVCADNSCECLATILGIMYAGLVAVPINYKQNADTIRWIISDCQASLLIADKSLLPAEKFTIPVVDISSVSKANFFKRTIESFSLEAAEVTTDTCAMIVYTSGSTGKPKGVPLTHKGQNWVLHSLIGEPPRLDNNTRLLVAAPLFHVNGLLCSLISLKTGGTVCLLKKFDAELFARSIIRHSCTFLTGVPTMFTRLMEYAYLLKPSDVMPVTHITIGSAPISDSLIESIEKLFPNAKIKNSYGTTETGGATFGDHPEGKETPRCSLGYPLKGIKYRLIDKVSDNEGIFLLETPATMTGYVNGNERAINTNLIDGWFNTGDIMSFDREGFAFFAGRADDMINCGGENIYPIEIERVLEAHPLINQVAVVGAPDEIKGEVPVAFVTVKDSQQFNEDILKTFALNHLSPYKNPRRIIVIKEFPLVGPNKIDRKRLKQLV